MTCYKKGGCGSYEMYSCSECPANKPDCLNKVTHTGIISEIPHETIEDILEISIKVKTNKGERILKYTNFKNLNNATITMNRTDFKSPNKELTISIGYDKCDLEVE